MCTYNDDELPIYLAKRGTVTDNHLITRANNGETLIRPTILDVAKQFGPVQLVTLFFGAVIH